MCKVTPRKVCLAQQKPLFERTDEVTLLIQGNLISMIASDIDFYSSINFEQIECKNAIFTVCSRDILDYFVVAPSVNGILEKFGTFNDEEETK